MELTLTYRGPLPSGQAKNKKARNHRNGVKLTMREHFHAQLMYSEYCRTASQVGAGTFLLNQIKPDQFPSSWSAVRVPKVKVLFAPLVITSLYLKLVCELDIEILSRDEPGSIVHSGDLDNRLKVLIDALRMPLPNENSIYTPPENKVCFCLLEDDKLITRFQAKTSRLLRPLSDKESLEDVEVTIKAEVRTSDRSDWPLKA